MGNKKIKTRLRQPIVELCNKYTRPQIDLAAALLGIDTSPRLSRKEALLSVLIAAAGLKAVEAGLIDATTTKKNRKNDK